MKYQPILLVGWLVALLFGQTALADEKKVTFVHVNDVYELQPRNGLGGVAYLETILKEYRQKDPQMVFTFGGDLLSPSLLSGMAKGAQMIEATNALGMAVAVPGNHEFDFGPENMARQLGGSRASWLAANMSTPDGSLVAGIKPSFIKEVNGIKVGFFGVITPHTATASKPGDQVVFAPFLATARQEVANLKAQGAQLVVALTHLLLAEDRQLALEVKGIDIILGGHDHDPAALYEHGVLIIKSGADNQYVSVVELSAAGSQDGTLQWQRAWQIRPVVGVAADPALQTIVDRWQKLQDDTLGNPLLTVAAPFNSLEGEVRTRENALANLVTDAMRAAVGAEVALFNGGGLRGNRTYPAGHAFAPRDILTELPFGNVTVLLTLSGRDLATVLESALSQVETISGRFPHVSGMRVSYDPSRPVGQRITAIQAGEAPLEPDRLYKVATTDYLAAGKDGYDMLRQGKLLIDPSGATLVANHVKEWLLAHQDWTPRLEGRMVRKEK